MKKPLPAALASGCARAPGKRYSINADGLSASYEF
jgi:hypothetical protein